MKCCIKVTLSYGSSRNVLYITSAIVAAAVGPQQLVGIHVHVCRIDIIIYYLIVIDRVQTLCPSVEVCHVAKLARRIVHAPKKFTGVSYFYGH